MDDFKRGFFIGISILLVCYDDAAQAADLIRQAGLEGTDCRSLNRYYRDKLQEVVDKEGIQLTLQ